MLIEFLCHLLAHQCGDQHDQSAFGQVEIGHQGIGHIKFEPRIDKYIRITRPLPNAACVARRRFDQSQRGGAHGDHAAAL